MAPRSYTTSERRRLRALAEAMNHAGSYTEWMSLAGEHDALSGAREWKAEEDNQLFDATDIRRRHDRLVRAIHARDAQDLLFSLNEGIHGNISGMGNPKLYGVARLGTKNLIADYLSAIDDALEVIADANEASIPFADKLDFFHRASRCYGRSALLLSGGGGMIYFHHGVVDALLEQQLLPPVLSGSSAGSWMCAQLGAMTDAELKGYFAKKRYTNQTTASSTEYMLRMGRTSATEEATRQLTEVIGSFLDDITFAEAFEHTGRNINISIASADKHHRARLLNAITSPNVTLRSACRASSAIPNVFDPAILEAKDRFGRVGPYLETQRWIDGAFSDDLPMKRLSRLYGVNHFIVSQINLMSTIAPFVRPDPKSGREGVLYQASQMFFTAMRNGSKLMHDSALPIFAEHAQTALGTFHDIFDQDYAGDITIAARFHRRSLDHVLFNFSHDGEISALIDEGRRATWSRIEQIRNATTISRTLDRTLEQLEVQAGRHQPALARASAHHGG